MVPPPWSISDARPDECTNNLLIVCVTTLARGRFDDAYILVGRARFQIPPDTPLEQLDDNAVAGQAARGVSILSTERIEIDSEPAMWHRIFAASQGATGYGFSITARHGRYVYAIVGAFRNEALFNQQAEVIDTILASIDFK